MSGVSLSWSKPDTFLPSFNQHRDFFKALNSSLYDVFLGEEQLSNGACFSPLADKDAKDNKASDVHMQNRHLACRYLKVGKMKLTSSN